MNPLFEQWLKDHPVPWGSANPVGPAPVSIALSSDTPAGWLCFRNIEDQTLIAVMPGTQVFNAARDLWTADGRQLYVQIPLRTPGT